MEGAGNCSEAGAQQVKSDWGGKAEQRVLQELELSSGCRSYAGCFGEL